MKVFSAVTHAAIAQVGLGGGGETDSGGEGFPPGVSRFAIAIAQLTNDLLDLHDLFVAGANKAGKGFPRVLLEQAQATAGFLGGSKMRIVLGEIGEDFF